MKLKPDEVICTKCDGIGEVLPRSEHFGIEVCPKCDGFGKLDWIENIMGKLISRLDPITSRDPNGPVDLYYEGNKLFETTKSGIRSYMKIASKT